MNKLVLSFIAILLRVGAFAESVDVNLAKRVAESFLSGVEVRNHGKLHDITSSTPFNEFYVFSIGDEGFILISGNDCTVPILGYSFTNRFDIHNMPQNVKSVLDSYEEEIKFFKSQSNNDNNAIAEQWKMLKSGTMPEANYPTSRAPLLRTTWNQGLYYNSMCPYDVNYHEHSATGCVATATAQIMKYWNWPTNGYGSHSYSHNSYGTLNANFGASTYDWNNMPNELSTNSSATEINAIATLMYHIGVAIEMDYGVVATGGSSGYGYSTLGEINASSQHALIKYFKYSPDMQVLSQAEYSTAEWKAVLMGELDQNRPILYSGRGPMGGHSYVCDGYNQYGMFHINWGWGGYCDGYYEMGTLNPSEGNLTENTAYSFNLKNVAVIGIRPNNYWNTNTVVTASCNNTNYGTVTGGGTYIFNNNVEIKALAANGYRFKQWNDGSKYNPRKFVATGGSYNYTAIFEPLQGDTLGYSANTCLGTLGIDDWGIKLPASLFPYGDTLRAVQFYVYEEGTYNLTVYTGTNSREQSVHTSTYVATEAGNWQTIHLSSPAIIAPNQSVWITFHNTDATYPAAISYYSGGGNSFLASANFIPFANTSSFMIRGIFGQHNEEDNIDTADNNCIEIQNDTISYCGNNLFARRFGNNINDTAFQWGILLSANTMESSNVLESILLYTQSIGNYIMKIYQGNPTNLIHRQEYIATDTGWNNIALPTELPIDNNQDLWIIFSSPNIEYPASACNSSGCLNSNWFSVGNGWGHMAVQDSNYSWLIKCIIKKVYPITIQCLGSGHGMVSTADSTGYNICGQTSYCPKGDTATYIFTVLEGSTIESIILNDSNYPIQIQPIGHNSYSLAFSVSDTTTLDATFSAIEYLLTVNTSNANMGTTIGSGTYLYADTATITAIPYPETYFAYWNDGDTSNPRTIIIDQDTAFCATFRYFPIYDTISDTICSNKTYSENGFDVALAGTYTDTIATATGRDSIITLILTAIPTAGSTDIQTACDSLTWMDGITYSESTDSATYILTAVNGCDSVITLILTINHSTHDTIADTAINKYTWNGTTYTESGVYEYIGTTSDGCDSIVSLILTITTLGIESASEAESLTLYPNPTSGSITFSHNDIQKIEVLDAVGRMMATYRNSQTIDLSQLSKGYYTLRITTAQGVAIRKVVRQ